MVTFIKQQHVLLKNITIIIIHEIWKKIYDFRNMFNNIRSSSSYHGYLIGRFQSELIQQTVTQNTGHEA